MKEKTENRIEVRTKDEPGSRRQKGVPQVGSARKEVAVAFIYFNSKRLGHRYRSNKTLKLLYSPHKSSCHENICRKDTGKPRHIVEKVTEDEIPDQD